MEHTFKQHYATEAVATATKMLRSRVFGPDSLFVSFTLDKWHTEQNQFSSVVMYGTMTTSDPDLTNQSHPLVFKFKHSTPEKRELCRNDQQFHNEILFYEQVAPFLLALSPRTDGDCHTTLPLCRYFYGRNDCGDLVGQDLIVLENETIRGYRSAVAEHTINLDFDHLVLALRSLAKFHGLSYRAKHVDQAKFTELVAKAVDSLWNVNGEWLVSSKVFEGLLSNGLDTLAERKGRNDRLAHRFRTEQLADAIKTLKRVMEPDEPYSVLCHGDFGPHNLLFRYDGDGRPSDALAYDMALIRYGSPALDLSYFLYLSSDHKTRTDHWDELLDVYCETLATVAGSALVPDRARLDVEMREHGFYGLAFASLASRVLLEDQKKFDMNKLAGLNDDEQLRFWLSYGGERASESIADIVLHYLEVVHTD